MVNMTQKVLGGGLALIMAIVFVGVAGAMGNVTTEAFAHVDSATDWSDAQASITSANTDNGTLQLESASTSGSWTSVNYSVTNQTSIAVDATVGENSSLTATVTGYDSGGAQVSQQTYTLSDGQNALDISGQDGVEFSVQYDLSRDTTSDSSPTVQSWTGSEEVEDSTLLDAAVVLFLLAAAAGVIRYFM